MAHFRGVIADSCEVIADPCGDRRPRGRRCWSLRDSLNILKHHETLVKHCDTLWNVVKHREPLVKHYETLLKHCETSQNTQTLAIRCDDMGARCGDIGARAELSAILAMRSLYNSADMCVTELLIMEIWVLFPNRYTYLRNNQSLSSKHPAVIGCSIGL